MNLAPPRLPGQREVDSAEPAALWREAALSEHASIAAFARFVVHLLALGAPPMLLREAIRAMDDELIHAQLCFGMARRLDGRMLGPGPLDVSGLWDGQDTPSKILEAAIREGCVVETISARLAQVACERATEPFAVEALRRITHDEMRHADLAWSFVEWILERRSELYEVAVRCFAEMLRHPPEVVDGADERLWHADDCGQLSPHERTQLALKICEDEIEPRAARLLARAHASSEPKAVALP
jgi:hypothetical protein